MIERGDAGERDRATDRAASAARTLATVAHNAAREHVQRDAVTTHLDGNDADMVARAMQRGYGINRTFPAPTLDTAEAERQSRLRRWQALPHPNRKGG